MLPQFSSVQGLRRVWLLVNPWIAAHEASLSIANSQSSFRLTSIESVMPSSHLILCRPLLLLPPVPPSIRVFSNESTLSMKWPKYWSLSFSVCPSNELPGLISFRMDWLDLLAVQGTLKSLLQHHSSKVSFLCTQLSSQFNSHIHTWPLENPYPWLDGPLFLFTFCHKGGVICIYEVIDISPRTLDSSSCFFQLSISHDVLCIAGWQYIALTCFFSYLEQSVVPYPVLTVASWPAYRFLKRQVRWSGMPISFRIFHSWLWSTQSKALA